MPIRWIKPKQLTRYLKQQLDDGYYRLTWEEIAEGIFEIDEAKSQHIIPIKWVWPRSEKQLRMRGTCAILVTDFYFSTFTDREPEKPEAVRMCIALHGRAAAGVRLLSMKGSRNDPMAIAYLQMRMANVQGGQAAILDRITVEVERGKLAPAVARRLVTAATEPALPAHEVEFAKLMGLKNNERLK